jgi:hypothetical protein
MPTRSIFNAQAFSAKPQVIMPKNNSGKLIVLYDQISMTGPVINDPIFCMEIPPYHKVLSVRVVNNENVASGVFVCGISASKDVNAATDNVLVPADSDAFLLASTLAPATAEHVMPTEGVAGFLAEYERPVFLTVTFTTLAPVDTKRLNIIVEVLGE